MKIITSNGAAEKQEKEFWLSIWAVKTGKDIKLRYHCAQLTNGWYSSQSVLSSFQVKTVGHHHHSLSIIIIIAKVIVMICSTMMNIVVKKCSVWWVNPFIIIIIFMIIIIVIVNIKCEDKKAREGCVASQEPESFQLALCHHQH